MTKVFYLFFLLLLNSCDFISNEDHYGEYYDLYTDKEYYFVYEDIQINLAKNLEKSMKLRCIGWSSHAMGTVKSLGLDFTCNRSVDIENARRMIVEAAEIFLQTINQDKRIRPYLITYPFTASNISLAIFFTKPDGSLYQDLSYVSLERGFIRFYIDRGTNVPRTLLSKETYEEALKIVEEENLRAVL